MFRRLLFQALTLSLSGLSCASALAFDEVEPNDDFTTANDASRTGVIRGVIEPGANARYDHFRISSLVTYRYNLHVEIRILTGPQAGSENFGFWLQPVALPNYSALPQDPNSVGSGNGSRVIHVAPGYQAFATLHLRVEFPPQISSGTYEIRYTLVPDGTREEAPLIKTDVRRAPGSARFIVKIGTDTSWPSIMHRLTARADDHPKAIIVTNYFDTKFINTPRGPDIFSNTPNFEMPYRMKLQRPVTRLVIIAEDSGGLKSSKTLVFRKSADRPSAGSSRFPKPN